MKRSQITASTVSLTVNLADHDIVLFILQESSHYSIIMRVSRNQKKKLERIRRDSISWQITQKNFSGKYLPLFNKLTRHGGILF